MPLIDQDKCRGCGLCVDICGCHNIEIVKQKAVIVAKNSCKGCQRWCTLCEDICPNKAVYCAFEVVIENTKKLK